MTGNGPSLSFKLVLASSARESRGCFFIVSCPAIPSPICSVFSPTLYVGFFASSLPLAVAPSGGKGRG